MKTLINKLIRITLGLLGVAMVDSCVAKAEYPNPNYAGGPITDTLWTSHAGEYVSRDDNFGDGNWYMGAYEAGADVTMLKK